MLVQWIMELSAAGPSNSIESSDSGPSTSSSGPAAFDSSRSEPEDSQDPSQEVNVRVASLLSRLKSPRPSDFVRNVLYVFVIVRKGHFVAKKPGHNGHFLQHSWYVS